MIFNEVVSYVPNLRKKVGGMKLDELPGLDALTLPGATSIQILYFKSCRKL